VTKDIFKPLPGRSLLEKQLGMHGWFHHILTVGSRLESKLAATRSAFPGDGAGEDTLFLSHPCLTPVVQRNGGAWEGRHKH